MKTRMVKLTEAEMRLLIQGLLALAELDTGEVSKEIEALESRLEDECIFPSSREE